MKNLLSKIFFIALFLSVFITSCLEEFNAPLSSSLENILIVEGTISDVNASIRLSRSVGLGNDSSFLAEENAQITLEDESGNIYARLTHQSDGLYQASDTINTTIPYRVRIEISDNEAYVSELLTFLPTPPIEELDWEFISNDQLQIQVSTTGNETTSPYYFWNYEETWEYFTRLNSYFIYQDGEVLPRPRDQGIYTCWQNKPSISIQVLSTVNLSENVVSKFPLQTFNPLENGRLAIRYSILVKQYALTKEAFEFWKLLKGNTENVGTLFDAQPSQLSSNLTSVNDPNRPVIGFISASQEQQKRIFIARDDVPFEGVIEIPRPVCEVDSISLNPDEIRRTFESGVILPITEVSRDDGLVIGYQTAPISCSDCRVLGGTNKRPDFW